VPAGLLATVGGSSGRIEGRYRARQSHPVAKGTAGCVDFGKPGAIVRGGASTGASDLPLATTRAFGPGSYWVDRRHVVGAMRRRPNAAQRSLSDVRTLVPDMPTPSHAQPSVCLEGDSCRRLRELTHEVEAFRASETSDRNPSG